MNLYRQSIILFGLVAPLAAAALVVGGFAFVKSKMNASFEKKKSHFKSYEQSRLAGLEIEAEIARQREHLARWDNQLSGETASTVGSNLREIYAKLPSKEIQQTAFERPSGASGIGNASAQDASQIRIALRGTFRTLQRAFVDLETRMPQLQLQELSINPSNSQSALLNFQVTYTAWEN